MEEKSIPIVITRDYPDFDGLIDQDILDRFEGSSVFYGDIINAQLIKTNKELVKLMKDKV